jgi:hypothetical protein
MIGGTSLATPMWAGIVARLDQKRSIGLSPTWSWTYAVPQQAYNDVSPRPPGAADRTVAGHAVSSGTCFNHDVPSLG